MAATSPFKTHDGDIDMKDSEESSGMADGKESNPEVATISQNLQQDQKTSSLVLQPLEGEKLSSESMTKKRKLTVAEKAEAQALKDVEVHSKAEEKARKEDAKHQKEEEKRAREEEKRLKEEERRIKQEEARKEREEKQKIKDAIKAEKDIEKKAKEDAQAKKQKSQLRLGAFFKTPVADAETTRISSRRSSLGSVDVDTVQDVPAPAMSLQHPNSDYDKAFPSFFLHAHTTLAPIDLHPIDEPRRQWAIDQIEDGKNQPNHRPSAVLGKRKRVSYVPQPPVKRILLEMQGSTLTDPIELDSNRSEPPHKIFKTLPIKYLKFKEDVRPPWIGTYSKAPKESKFATLCRNPFQRGLPQVNYDYDSEVEWEEPEEGEELNSEGEEDDDDDDDDMEEFLDDEAAEALPKRKQLVGDLEPICSNLNWENSSRNNTQVQFGSTTLDLEQFRIGVLFDTPIKFPIDPFSTSYWPTDPRKKPTGRVVPTNSSMQAPVRVPLNILKGHNQLSPTIESDIKPKPGKIILAAKPFPPELLADFKRAISGSKLSKVGLIEVLKKDFPSVTKKTVEQTLLQVARRIGRREAEKVWQLVD